MRGPVDNAAAGGSVNYALHSSCDFVGDCGAMQSDERGNGGGVNYALHSSCGFAEGLWVGV